MPKNLPVIRLSDAELMNLLEYSTSLPTGTTVGKRWKRAKNIRAPGEGWLIGEYTKSDVEGQVGISWFDVVIGIQDTPCFVGNKSAGWTPEED